jgi:hypothetical protein
VRSTNFSWRGFFVQSNNALILRGKSAVTPFLMTFDNYWNNDKPATFGKTDSAEWTSLGLSEINAKVAFSTHSSSNELLQLIADDIGTKTTSNPNTTCGALKDSDGATVTGEEPACRLRPHNAQTIHFLHL